MKPINDLLATHGVPVYDPDDATLSSGARPGDHRRGLERAVGSS